MPPPAAPAANANANGRTQPSSPQTAAPPTPQQGNKANPKKKNETKETKAKRATKKGSAANLNAGATPSADPTQEAATPTPATPITPVHQNSFKTGPNGAVQPVANGQPIPSVPNAGVSSAQPDMGFNMNDNQPVCIFSILQLLMSADSPQFDNFEFQNPAGSMDVLTDFDFDSFLNDTNGGDNDNYNFDPSFLQETEISEAV
ncbi:SOM1 protein [Rutstroemia sp. NJR-2017a WRK4]|nr:SOM1 protein [Rutstroemia sp. NJR-2017a WRK4]